MSQLTLIRHGQAAAFSDDPDRLTELGETQARRLGEYLADKGVEFHDAITGGLRRQRQTAQLVAEAYAAKGRAFPDIAQDDGWNEYDAGAVMGALAPALEAADPAFAKLASAAREALGGPEQNRHFQRMFEVLMAAWVDGSTHAEGVEAFDAFHGRVIAARDRIVAGPGGRHVGVFTSGGPIGANVAASLHAPPAQSMKVNWRVRNASLTEFTFSGSRLSFDGFNGLPHFIDHPQLLTYR